MTPYGCLSTGSSVGLIEVVHDSMTIAKLQKNKGVGAFNYNCILDWLKEFHPTKERCVYYKVPPSKTKIEWNRDVIVHIYLHLHALLYA